MDGIGTLYLFVLAGVAGYVMIARVPSVLHLPLLSGANFVHGAVLCGAMLALARADGNIERTVGSIAVGLGAANVVGGYLVTDRLLTLFERRAARSSARAKDGRTPGRKASATRVSTTGTSAGGAATGKRSANRTSTGKGSADRTLGRVESDSASRAGRKGDGA